MNIEYIFEMKDSEIYQSLIIRLLHSLKQRQENLNIYSTTKSEDLPIHIAENRNHKRFGAEAGGNAAGAFFVVNKLYEEEKFHARQGHGFAAERANNLTDNLTGKQAKILGDDNTLNGPDRFIFNKDGSATYIQSKYCQTGDRCVNECFDKATGEFRYFVDGKPMQVEVPSDKYADAVAAMKNKIIAGRVKDVTDPNEAENIIRKGHFTYEQAKNIAKAGTVESLTYDSITGIISGTCAFGVTAMIIFAVSLWNGDDYKLALKKASYEGIRVGGVAFCVSVFSSQLAKAGFNSMLVNSSEAIVQAMGPKAAADLINAFRLGEPIYGAAAMKSAAKLIRGKAAKLMSGNMIVSSTTVIVMSSVDVVRIFRGRISVKQLVKNSVNNVSTIAGGAGGWAGGAALGSMICPGVGTVAGALLGSIIGGSISGSASNIIMSSFIEDDAVEMCHIIENRFKVLATDYILNHEEADKISEQLNKILDGSLLQDMFASYNRQTFADEILIPQIETVTKKRKYIHVPTCDEMQFGLRVAMEEIAVGA